MLFQWAAVTFSIHTPFKVLFFVKHIGQWNAKSGPKAAYGNFAMRKKNSGSLKKKWKRKGRNGSHFAHTHTHSAKLVVRIQQTRHNLKNLNPKNTKKSPIHENADANTTCNFSDSDISLLGVAYLTHVCDTYYTYIATSIILRYREIHTNYMLHHFTIENNHNIWQGSIAETKFNTKNN